MSTSITRYQGKSDVWSGVPSDCIRCRIPLVTYPPAWVGVTHCSIKYEASSIAIPMVVGPSLKPISFQTVDLIDSMRGVYARSTVIVHVPANGISGNRWVKSMALDLQCSRLARSKDSEDWLCSHTIWDPARRASFVSGRGNQWHRRFRQRFDCRKYKSGGESVRVMFKLTALPCTGPSMVRAV